MTDNLSDLFAGSGLADDAVGALDLTADNLGDAIMVGLGDVDAEAIEGMRATEVTLLVRTIDDSGSIGYSKNTDAVIGGENLLIDSLIESKVAGAVLVATLLLNGGLLQPFVRLEHAVRLDHSNYRPSGTTPLYDTVATGLAMMTAKVADLENGGLSVRGITNITTDGADVSSTIHRPATVAAIVRGMLRTESHIIGGMGIDDGSTNFRDTFRSMGLQDAWILTPGNSPSEIRRAYGTVSRSAVRASQAAGPFSQTAMGGFGTD